MNRSPLAHEHAPPGDRLLDVEDLRITSRIGGRRRTIVTDIALGLAPGETIGIVGESGSGKSMTARALIGLLPEGLTADGRIQYAGHDLLALPEREMAAIRGAEIGLVLQDPYTMLNPLRRCGRHIEETLRQEARKQRRSAAHRDETIRRLAEVDITDPGVADRYPFQLSGGMLQRVAIAAALARDPSILIADEPTTALDVTTQRDVLALLKSLQERRGMGLILITHDLRIAFSLCDRVYVFYAGRVLEVGPAVALEDEPLHPYTLGLILSEPPGDRRVSQLVAIDGAVPTPDDVADRCAFAARCRWREAVCVAERPPLERTVPGRRSACVRIGAIRPEMSRLRASAEQATAVIGSRATHDVLLRVRDLHKVFDAGSGRSESEVHALAGVDLEVAQGESVGLVGESGSGKTTLGRCVLGLETPTSGEIAVDGIPATDYAALDRHDRATLRRSAQIIFQDPYTSLNPARSIDFQLREALGVRGHRDAGARIPALLEQVGLPAEYRSRKPVALSGGERQRVAIARALAVEPRLLVCDEPVSALDVSVQAQILNLFKELREQLGLAYLFISHDLAVVRQVVERIYVLLRGEIVESGLVDEVLDDPQHEYTARLVSSVPRTDGTWLVP